MRNRKKGKDFYLLSNFADEKMTEAQIIQGAINNYRKRWKIEEVHRQMKQDLGWESIRLASYTKLKNLNMFLTLALYFIYSCKEIITKLAVAFPKIICYQTKDWAKLQQFIYYRISQVLQICYRISRHYDTSPYRADLIEPWQRKIRLV